MQQLRDRTKGKGKKMCFFFKIWVPLHGIWAPGASWAPSGALNLGPRGLEVPSWGPGSGPQGPQGPQLGPWTWAPWASTVPAGALDLGPMGLKGPSCGPFHKKKVE